MKKTTLFLLLLGLLLAIPATVSAYTLKAEANYYLDEGEVVDDNVYTAGQSIIIKGTIKGDLICAGQNIAIDGTVEGSVYCAGQTININGRVGGSARLIAQTISLGGNVDENAFMIGSFLSQQDSSAVGGDIFMAGMLGDIQGQIGRDLHGALSQLNLNGQVGRNVKFRLDERSQDDLAPVNQDFQALKLGEQATIGGEISYSAGIRAQVPADLEVPGGVHYHQPTDTTRTHVALAWGGLISLFSALVAGMVLVTLWGRQIIGISGLMLARPGASFGWGALLMFLTPVICLFLLFTLIGIPLGLAAFALWLIALYAGQIITGIMVGRGLLKRAWTKKQDSLIWAMIIGVIIVSFLSSLPFLGWLFSLLATLWGLGGLWLYFRREK